MGGLSAGPEGDGRRWRTRPRLCTTSSAAAKAGRRSRLLATLDAGWVTGIGTG